VNDNFVNVLEAQMPRNPDESFGALFVKAKGFSDKHQWNLEDKDSYTFEVFGGTLFLWPPKECIKSNLTTCTSQE